MVNLTEWERLKAFLFGLSKGILLNKLKFIRTNLKVNKIGEEKRKRSRVTWLAYSHFLAQKSIAIYLSVEINSVGIHEHTKDTRIGRSKNETIIIYALSDFSPEFSGFFSVGVLDEVF